MIEATVMCDSINKHGNRLTTFRLRYPRFIHAEFMTHRMISRNASSSRAVPAAKLMEEVRTDALRAAPELWGAEQKGMQAGEALDGLQLQIVQKAWGDAAAMAALCAEYMARQGLHKSICNRLLEPFSHINVVASATEWDNFFGLRLDKAAEPTMRALAEAMWAAYSSSVPVLRRHGLWHLPYVDEADYEPIYAYAKNERADTEPLGNFIALLARKVSAARCARVSYEDFETRQRSTVVKDLGLYNKLVGSQPLHASPIEHQATSDDRAAFLELPQRNDASVLTSHSRHLWGNFVGWIQARKLLDGEACAPLPAGYVKRVLA